MNSLEFATILHDLPSPMHMMHLSFVYIASVPIDIHILTNHLGFIDINLHRHRKDNEFTRIRNNPA